MDMYIGHVLNIFATIQGSKDVTPCPACLLPGHLRHGQPLSTRMCLGDVTVLCCNML